MAEKPVKMCSVISLELSVNIWLSKILPKAARMMDETDGKKNRPPCILSTEKE